LCLRLQGSARSIARHFDELFRDLGITNGQFSLLNAVSGEAPIRVSDIASLLAMDRTTVTAALKPLLRDRYVKASDDPTDHRVKRIGLTARGKAILTTAAGRWREQHRSIESALQQQGGELRAELSALEGALTRPKGARGPVGHKPARASR
jgi:DNA-binding MarR family transcriptional regulator